MPRSDVQASFNDAAVTADQLATPTSRGSLVSRLQAWMLALPVDYAALALPGIWNHRHFRGLLALATLAVILLAGAGRYRARLHLSFLDELPSLLGRSLLAAAVVACVTALRHASQDATSFLRVAVVSILLLLAGRLVVNSVILFGRRTKRVAHPTILLGGGPVSADLASLIFTHARYGLSLVGYVDDRPATTMEIPWAGPSSQLDRIVHENGIEVLIVADPLLADETMEIPLRDAAVAHVDLLVVPRLHQFHTQAGLIDHIGAIPIMRIRLPVMTGPARWAKRLFDFTLSSIAMVLLAPLLVSLALLIRVFDGPGVFFRQGRLTRNGRPFELIKFRSMRPVDHGVSDVAWTADAEMRISALGRFLRRTSFDELPQLWNIVRGDMTIVGPRPERPFFVEKFSAEHPRYRDRHRVPCGLTGLAQVSGLRGDTSIPDRARYDNFYIENWTLWMDAKVILRTVREVIGARGR